MPSFASVLRDPVTTHVLRGAKYAGKGMWRGATAGPIGRTAFGAGVGATVGFFGSDYESPTLTANAVLRGAMFGAVTGFGTATAGRAAMKGLRANQALGRRAYMSKLAGPRMASGDFFSYGAIGAPLTEKEVLRRMVGPATAFKSSPLGFITGRFGRAGVRGGKGLGKLVQKTAMFALEHPVATAGIIGAGALAGAATGFTEDPFVSPTLSGANVSTKYNQQAIAARELQMSMIAPVGAVGPAPQMLGNMQRKMMQSTDGLVQGLHRGRH